MAQCVRTLAKQAGGPEFKIQHTQKSILVVSSYKRRLVRRDRQSWEATAVQNSLKQ